MPQTSFHYLSVIEDKLSKDIGTTSFNFAIQVVITNIWLDFHHLSLSSDPLYVFFLHLESQYRETLTSSTCPMQTALLWGG